MMSKGGKGRTITIDIDYGEQKPISENELEFGNAAGHNIHQTRIHWPNIIWTHQYETNETIEK